MAKNGSNGWTLLEMVKISGIAGHGLKISGNDWNRWKLQTLLEMAENC